MKKIITRQLNKFFEAAVVKASSVFVCAILSVITVICVGFSSWIMVNPNVKYTVNASPFEVYTVTDSQNYINLTDAKGFSYYYTGFTKGNGKLSTTGDISFNVAFKSKTAKDFLEANSMNLQFTLYFTGIIDKDSAEKIIPNASCKIAKNEITSCERGTTNGEYYLRASADSKDIVTESTTETSFQVTFTLKNNTYAELYDYLQKGGTFMIEARVSKKL